MLNKIANILKSLQSSAQSNGGATAQLSIAADVRTNSLIISGNQSSRLRMRVIITQLDTSSPTGQGTTQVVFLHYLKAKKIAPILDKVVKGQSKQLAAVARKGAVAAGGGADSLADLSAVLPQESDNALIITAPTSLMKNLKAIVTQLDVRPSQVYVQAILVDMSASAMQQLGVQWGTFGFSENSLQDQTGSQSSPNSAFQGGAGVGIIQNGHFQLLLAAIKGISGADVLSEPSLMVLNNQKATFSIGTQLSFQTSQTGALGGNTTNPQGLPTVTSQFKQESVGLKLNVTPQINRGNSVQLLIDQTNGSLQNPDNPGATPIVNKSNMKTSVLVNSGDILVLGGLMSNEKTVSTYRTPFLSDLPLIGHLFSYTSRKSEKKRFINFLKARHRQHTIRRHSHQQ